MALETTLIADVREENDRPTEASADNFAILRKAIQTGSGAVVVDLGVRDGPAASPATWLVPRDRADDFFAFDLCDFERWTAPLLHIEPGHESRDLASLARLLHLWLKACGPIDAPPLWDRWHGAISRPVPVTEILALLYTEPGDVWGADPDVCSGLLGGAQGVGAWRRFLRDLGIGGRMLADDPWLQRLLLNSMPSPFSKSPIVLVPLLAPRCPLDVAYRMTACVLDRALEVRLQDGSVTEVFLMDGEPMYPLLPELLVRLASFPRSMGASRLVLRTVRTMGHSSLEPAWARRVRHDPYAFQVAEGRDYADEEVSGAFVQLSRLKHGRDREFVERELSRAAPGWARFSTPDWQRGLYYQYPGWVSREASRCKWQHRRAEAHQPPPAEDPLLGAREMPIALPETL